MSISKEHRKLVDKKSKYLVDCRDAMEHMDERIGQDRIGQQTPITLKLTGDDDTIQIGNEKVKLEDLAGAIESLHEIGAQLI